MTHTVSISNHYQALSPAQVPRLINQVNRRLLHHIDQLVPFDLEGRYDNLPHNTLAEASRTNANLAQALQELAPEIALETVIVTSSDKHLRIADYIDIQ